MRSLLAVALLVACGKPEGDTPEVVDTAPPEDSANRYTDAIPMVGGTLDLSPDGTLAAAADIAGDRVLLVDVAGREVVGQVWLKRGDRPGRVLLEDDGRAFVVLRGGGGIARLDLDAETELWRTETCPEPRGMAVDGDKLRVACASGELLGLDLEDGRIHQSVMVEYDLRDVVIDGDELLVSTFKKAEVLRLTRDGTVLGRRSPPMFDDQVAGDPTAPDFQFSPSVAWRMRPHPDGGVLLVHQRGSDLMIPAIPVADPNDPPPRGGYYGQEVVVTQPDPVDPERTGCLGVVHTALTWFPPNGGDPQTTRMIPYAFLATDGAFMPDGRIAVLAAAAFDETRPEAGDIIYVDDSAFNVTTECTAFPEQHIRGSSQIGSIEVTPSGTEVTLGRSPFAIYIDGNVVPIEVVEEADPYRASVMKTGFNMFHEDASVGMTCAMCHPEGLEDGRVWNNEELGLRRTQSMAGGLKDTAPFHWGGEHETFDELAYDVLTRRLGRPVIPEEIDALGDWMDGILAPRATPFGTPLQMGDGSVLFKDPEVGCFSCHSGHNFTGNATADVGTGMPVQVPKLKGVGLRGPWIHDGCAQTLHDRFDPDCGGGDAHGKTSHLTPEEIDALVVYLQSL